MTVQFLVYYYTNNFFFLLSLLSSSLSCFCYSSLYLVLAPPAKPLVPPLPLLSSLQPQWWNSPTVSSPLAVDWANPNFWRESVAVTRLANRGSMLWLCVCTARPSLQTPRTVSCTVTAQPLISAWASTAPLWTMQSRHVSSTPNGPR